MTDDCNVIQEPQEVKRGLWFIVYTDRTEALYRGVALVRALDAGEAERVFRSSSKHNGNANNIKINKLYQVPDFYTPLLLGEEYFKIQEKWTSEK